MGRSYRLALCAGFTLVLCACIAPQVGDTCQVRSGNEEDLRRCLTQVSSDVISPDERGQVDILFLIDNSPSMSPKQKALAQNIPRFIQAIEQKNIDYHVGITTSDVGALAAGQPFTMPLPGCDTFAGDDGLLQRVPCSSRKDLAGDALAACQELCPDPSFVPADGKGFISKVAGVTNVPHFMAAGVDIGPQRAFQCMALVGDVGCGIEGQLEGARRALDGHLSRADGNGPNDGFLRPNSTLALIFVTDEDDCSVSPEGRVENDPATMDCRGAGKDADFRCFNPDYRCMARDVICDEPTASPGEKHACQERQHSYLQSVDTYVRFFQGLRPTGKLVVSGIWAPSIDAGGKFVVAGGPATYDLNRGIQLDAACVNAADPTIFGRPQVRLSKFISAFKSAAQEPPIEHSICDVDTYPMALDNIVARILTHSPPCLSVTPRTGPDGRPICLVGDVDQSDPHGAPDQPFPVCSTGCCQAWAAADAPGDKDPAIQAACAAEPADACYCAVASTVGVCQGGAVAGVVRKMPTPAGKLQSFRCLGG